MFGIKKLTLFDLLLNMKNQRIKKHFFRDQTTCSFRGRRSTFARSGTDFVAVAELAQSTVQISWQAQHFHKVRYRFRGRRRTFARSGSRRSTFARSGTHFAAGAALS